MSSDRSVEMDVGSSVSDSELVRLDTSIDVHDKEIGNDKYACDFTDKTTLTIDEFIEINKPGGVEVNERGGDECECRLVNDEMKIMKEKQATNLVKSINVDEETASNIIVEKIQKSNLQQSVQENSNKSHVGKDKNVGDMEYRKNISNEIATPKKKVLPNLDNFTDVDVEEVACDNTTVETKNSVFTHLNKSLDIKYRDKDQDHGDFLPHEDNQVTNLSIAEKRKIIQEKLANISNEDNHPHEENQATNLSIAKKMKIIQEKFAKTLKPKIPLEPISRNLASERMRMIREKQEKFNNLGKSSPERNNNPISRNLAAEKMRMIREQQEKFSHESKLLRR